MPAAQEQKPSLVTSELQPALDRSSLPLPDDHLILEPANQVEYEQTWRLNADEWRGFLSEPSYLDRELFLANAEICKDGGATAWILTTEAGRLPLAEDGSRPILASCETNRKNAYVAKDGKLEKVISHGIGSVYTRREYRGKGYAAKMVSELGNKLDNFQQLKNKKGRFSVLYSDIGPKFYAKHGWKPFSSTHITLRPIDNQGEYHQRKAVIASDRELKDLATHDLDSLTGSWTTQLEDKLTSISAQNPSKTYVAFKPEPVQFHWHLSRQEFLAEYIGRKKPEVNGVLDTKTGAALVWTRTYSAQASDWHLSILYVHVPHNSQHNEDDLRQALSCLMLRAQWEAKVWDMVAGVEIWDPNELVILAARDIAYGQDVTVISRDAEHICSLKWNGADTDDVVWLANERYAWC